MTILRERQVWKREATARVVAVKGHMDRLRPAQEEHVRAAIRVLRARMGSLRAISRAFGVHEKRVERVHRGRTRATAGWAVRVAEALGVPVDDVLTGKFPRPGTCPLCGR